MTVRCRRTTSRWSRRWTIRSIPRRPINPAAIEERAAGQPLRASPGSALPVRAHHLPADRASHRGRDVAARSPHLAELQPELFCEISPELAAERGIAHAGWLTIMTVRGVDRARALVTARMRPLPVDGRTVHQVGLPCHWG